MFNLQILTNSNPQSVVLMSGISCWFGSKLFFRVQLVVFLVHQIYIFPLIHPHKVVYTILYHLIAVATITFSKQKGVATK